MMRAATAFIVMLMCFAQLYTLCKGVTRVDDQSILNWLRHHSILSGAPNDAFRSTSLITHVVKGAVSRVINEISDVLLDFANAKSGRVWQSITYNSLGNREVTFHFGVACVDRGSVTGDPIGLKIGPELLPEIDAARGKGKRTGNKEDIVAQCMEGELQAPPSLEFRVAEHEGEHRDAGDSYTRRSLRRGFTKKLFWNMYNEVLRGYEKENGLSDPDEVRNILTARGIGYGTGAYVLTNKTFTTEKQDPTEEDPLKRLPLLLQVAMDKHYAKVLETRPAEDVVEREISVGSAAKVTTYLTAIIIELYLLWQALERYFREVQVKWKDLTDAERETEYIPKMSADILTPLSFTFILALTTIPFMSELILGDINPSSRATMLSGFTVTHGTKQNIYSIQDSNPYAGTPFIVTGFLVLQQDSQYHKLAVGLPMGIGGILILAIFIAMFRTQFKYPECALLYDPRKKSLSSKFQTFIVRHTLGILIRKRFRNRTTDDDRDYREKKRALEDMMQWPISRHWLRQASGLGRTKELRDMFSKAEPPSDDLLLARTANLLNAENNV